MKPEKKSTLKTFLFILIGIIIFCIAVFYLVDNVFNGIFTDWFARKFIWQENYNGVYYTGLNLGSFRRFAAQVFFFLCLIVALTVWLTARYYGRKRRRETVEELARQLELYLTSEKNDLSIISDEFSSIRTPVSEMRANGLEKERLLEQENRQKNDLITYLAHDLKTPLASVIGYLCLLDESPTLPEDLRRKYIGITLEKSYRLEQLIQEFFEITRYNLHSIVVNPGRIHLETMFLQMADEFFPVLEPMKKSIDVQVPSDLILYGDADKLARVFNNILKNAAAYSYEDSVITVKAKEEKDGVLITFTNYGDPIPEHQQETIFEKFYRLDNSRSSKTGGSGLGLAIAKEIVSAHHGTIRVKSDLESTTFTVYLPQNEYHTKS